MRILYVGHLAEGQTSRDRMLALRRLGNEVVEFDIAGFEPRNRLLRSMHARWKPKFLLEDLNRAIAAAISATPGLDCLWVDKGIWILPETLMIAKRRAGCRLVHYTPDSQILVNRSEHFFQGMPFYDCLVTTKGFEVDDYRRMGAANLLLVPQSYCPVRFADPRFRPAFAHDVGLVADFKPHYGRVVRSLVEVVPDIGVWGPRWRRAARLRRVPARVVLGDGVWGADYVDALASFRIGLGLLSKYIPEQHTTRTFEIPAAGTFLLAERTVEHESFFREGEEAEFFGSMEELASKAVFYLANDSARQQIAARGRDRCHRSGYDNDSVLSRVMKEIR